MAYLKGLTEEVSKQAQALFGNLPPGIVGDDEPLHFKVNRDSSISVVVDRSGDLLSLFQGYAVRCRHTANGAEVEVYQDGKLVELLPVVVVPPDEDKRIWQQAPNAG